MTHRFRFIGESTDGGGTWQLAEDEAFHIAKVLRLAVGTEVEAADGRGLYATGILSSSSSRAATVTCDASSIVNEPAPSHPLTIALGALKPGIIDDILPPLTELGADRIVIFHQRDTAKSRIADKATDRWQRILLSSLKQCKRAWLPTLEVVDSLESLISTHSSAARYVLSPGANHSLLHHLTNAPASSVSIVVGGERGLDSAEELTLINANYLRASFGHNILRAITAAVAATAVAAQVRAAHFGPESPTPSS